jgi:hypothetical protein
MFKSCRAYLSALSLSGVIVLGALGAGASPARADGADAARVIGGIIALYAISRAIDLNANRSQPQVQQQYHAPARPRAHYTPPPPPPSRVAPDRCYREFQTRDGFFRGFAGQCLQRNVGHAPPQQCAREYRTDRGTRVFYGGRCMAQNGWVRETPRHR